MKTCELITDLLFDGGPTVVVECRNYGTTVSTDRDLCPACGSEYFLRYEIPTE